MNKLCLKFQSLFILVKETLSETALQLKAPTTCVGIMGRGVASNDDITFYVYLCVCVYVKVIYKKICSIKNLFSLPNICTTFKFSLDLI